MPSIHRAPVSPKVLASLDLGFFKPLIAWTFEPISKPIEPVLGGWDEIDGLPEHLTAFFQADPNPFNSRFGSGSSAAVCKGYIDFNGMTYVVAAKERYFGGESSQDVMLEEFAGVCLHIAPMSIVLLMYEYQKISREVKVLRRLKHPNIVNYLGVALGVPRHGHNQLSIITSVCDRGGLPSYVSHAPNCQRLSLALDIAHALEYLHENNIVHGQLKPQRNISITNSGAGVKAVLCDFSCARIIGDDGFVPWSSKDGSYRYTPQEIARPSDSNPVYVSKEGDIYAFAFVALFYFSASLSRSRRPLPLAMSNRLKRKLGDLGVDTSSRRANESFCLIGTPLPLLEKSKDTGEFVPLWKQEVRDEKGRKRLHGAFTGGFSAGYFNTVGSKEGWTPATFVSSRNDRAKAKAARPEDFMDEEDLQEIRDSKKIVDTTDEMDLTAGLRSSKDELETDSIAGALEASMLPAPQDSAGARILKKMGWKIGQGIGPRVSWRDRQQQDAQAAHNSIPSTSIPEDDEEASKHSYARRDTTVLAVTRKDNSHGLGYRPGMSLNESLGDNGAGPSSGPRLAAGFGLGALNDADEDDLDIYELHSTHSKRRTAYDALDRHDEDKTAVSQRGHDASRKTAGSQIFEDGKPVLPGFILSDKPVAEDRWFPLPDPPPGWRPDPKRVWDKDKENRSGVQAPPPPAGHGKWRPTMAADTRGTILGETPLPSAPRSVFDYMSQKDAERLKNIVTGKGTAPPGAPAPARDEINITRLDPHIAQAALNGFQPFTTDPVKQARYNAYLQTQISPDSTVELVPLPDQNISEFNKELSDYAKAAQIFKPISGAMAGRFTSAAVVEHAPKINEGLHMPTKEEIEAKEAEAKKLAEEKVSPKVHAARLGMYGPLTRDVKPWVPARLLCKRFGVKDPEVETKVPESSGHHSTTAGGDTEGEHPTDVDPVSAAALGITDKGHNGRRDLANIGLGDDETQGRDILTYTKPAMDIFKAIFASDDEDSDNEEDPPGAMDVDEPNPPDTNGPSIASSTTKDSEPVDLATFKPVFVPRESKSKGDEKKEKKEKRKKEKEKKTGMVSFAMDEDQGEESVPVKERPKKRKKRDKEKGKEKEGKKGENEGMQVDKPPLEVVESLPSEVPHTQSVEPNDAGSNRSLKGRKRAVDFM
ncbi:hypothetical protein EYR36_009345 [Pleurotus pulmonarius]|nr:hypothetical protein EYR36_009345 [Pleurotus pulmonarius]